MILLTKTQNLRELIIINVNNIAAMGYDIYIIVYCLIQDHSQVNFGYFSISLRDNGYKMHF